MGQFGLSRLNVYSDGLMTVPTAVTIGNFDGVHLGHAGLVRTAREAVDTGTQAGHVVVLSFDPHPLSVLRPQQAPPRLTNFRQRVQLLIEAGADQVVALTPTRQFLGQTARDFITSLVQSYQPQVLIEGPDFRFGKGREGNIETLADLGRSFGFETVIIDPVRATLLDHTSTIINSSTIRWLIQHGRIGDAGRLLGRSYSIQGTVMKGDQRGRTIGIPTANIDHGDILLPMDGVYAGFAERDGRRFAAAISVGAKPTFGKHARVCEAHLLEYEGQLDDYGWEITLSFERWIRDQLTYSNVQSLTEQIERDIRQVRNELQFHHATA